MGNLEILGKTISVYVDGELAGYADCVIDGQYYGDSDTAEKLQDNGEYIGVNDYGVITSDSIVIDCNAGVAMGTLSEILSIIKDQGFGEPTNPAKAIYSNSPIDNQESDGDIIVYWQE